MDDKPVERPLETPLTVDVIDRDVVLDGDPQVDVALTPEAAIETGIRLINAGMAIPEDDNDGAH